MTLTEILIAISFLIEKWSKWKYSRFVVVCF